MKINTFSRTMVCGLVIAFFLLPFNYVYADGYSSDSDFWRWWYIEHTTDNITNGSGASAENIENTDSGQTAGTVIYNQSGVTRGDFIDYVEEQYNQAEGYIQKGVDYYVDAVNHVYDSTVTAGTKAAYQTQKAVREVVDSTGKVIVDVSGSDFWHSAYNSLFNNNGYKDIYTNSDTETYTGEYQGHTYSLEWAGVCDLSNAVNDYSPFSSVIANQAYGYYTAVPSQYLSNNSMCVKVTVDNNTMWIGTGYNLNGTFNSFDGVTVSDSSYRFSYTYTNRSGRVWHESINIQLKGIPENTGNSYVPVLQPSQVGFIIYNGDRIPVYTDQSQNPFTVNDDGTVDYDGNTYPIYVDPEEISDDGWLKILEFIDNEDQTENPYNPQGQPWNTQNDGSVLGGLFSSLISDIGNLFNNIGDIFKNLIEKLINAIKGLFDMDYNTLDSVELEVNFNIIQNIIDNLLEYLGVT